MTPDPSWQMFATLAIVLIAVGAYAIERIPLELTSAAMIAALLVLFQLAPLAEPDGSNRLDARRLLAGFAEPALAAVVALMVVGQGLIRTGALEGLARRLAAVPRQSSLLAGLMLFVCAASLSAVFNNTPVVVLFIPIAAALARGVGQSVSGFMMPLSFAAILGGMTTLIGSSTNLLVSGSAQRLGLPGFGFFDITMPGVLLAGLGLLYVLLLAPRLLPDRASLARRIVGSDGKQFIAQIEVREGGGLAGQRPVAGRYPALPDMTVRLIQRGEHALLPPFEEAELRPGDVVVVAATRASLTEALAKTPDLLPAGDRAGVGDQILAEVMVAPASRMIGRNLQQIGFRYQTGCIVLGVQRRSRMIRASLDEIRLDPGDVLLVLGRREDVTALRESRDVLLLEWSALEVPALSRAAVARAIFAVVIVAAATDLAPIAVLAVCGAVAMVATGCLNVHQAARAIDRRIVFLIAAALAMGAALQETGGAAYLARGLVTATAGFNPAVTLSCFFLLIAAFTNIVSNNATAVLFTPIAVSMAGELGVPAVAFVHAVVFAANCSFATPVGYQTNLLVMGPGHYRFSDFLRAGGPLILLLWAAFSILAPWYYDL